MTITIEIPDEFASHVVKEGADPARQALEDMAVEAYREHRLTGKQLREILGIETRFELDDFLFERKVWLDYSTEDFRREGEIMAELLRKRQLETPR